jgi:hypothetical protein
VEWELAMLKEDERKAREEEETRKIEKARENDARREKERKMKEAEKEKLAREQNDTQKIVSVAIPPSDEKDKKYSLSPRVGDDDDLIYSPTPPNCPVWPCDLSHMQDDRKEDEE